LAASVAVYGLFVADAVAQAKTAHISVYDFILMVFP
jgi:hypothetical protein